jgi:hypothetical protein
MGEKGGALRFRTIFPRDGIFRDADASQILLFGFQTAHIIASAIQCTLMPQPPSSSSRRGQTATQKYIIDSVYVD